MKEIVVCLPFKKEESKVVIKNIKESLKYERTGLVLLVGYEENETYKAIEEFINKNLKKERVKLIIQKRIGNKRPGKGDGMNTGIEYFLKHTKFKVLHFYDSDIVTFNKKWIERVQNKIDEGFQVVRCYYPRAYTDAMITWNITKCGFAYIWPETLLPKIEQPLGGELAFTRKVAEKLFKTRFVRSASDWSIDTAYTLTFCKNKFPLYEVYIQEGKSHKFYGKLSDLRTMLIECFQILQESQNLKIDTRGMKYGEDPLGYIPDIYKKKIAFDINDTVMEFKKGWTKEEREIIKKLFPEKVNKGIKKALRNEGFEFMDPATWYECFGIFVKNFEKGNTAWESTLFHLWVARVLNHTFTYALKGYNEAMASLTGMVKYFRGLRLLERVEANQ